MKIRATDEQVSKMCALACQASAPMGMGFLHFDAETKFKPEDFPVSRGSVYLDYVQGRMVKLSLHRAMVGDPPMYVTDVWEADDQIRYDYQSWIARYPSYAELAVAAGAEVL